MSRLTRLKDATSVKTLYDRRFTYNTAGQISRITEPAKTRNFKYDPLNRLTGMTSPTTGVSAEKYWYDKVGNRTASHKSTSYKTENFNKLEATANTTYTYDANGNMTSKTVGGVTWFYKRDYEDRITSATSDKVRVWYGYDGLGRRVKRTRGRGRKFTKPQTTKLACRMTVSAASVAPGSTVNISWAIAADPKKGRVSRNVWFGLYRVGDDDSAVPLKKYETKTRSRGTSSWSMPREVGDYEVRCFSSDGVTKVGTSPKISVTATSFELILPYKLDIWGQINWKELFLPGESMKITWQAPAGQASTTDWIGLYKVGDADTAVAQWRQNTGGGVLGNLSAKMPSASGDYEFRYFSGAGNVRRATSRTIKVIDTTSYQMTPSATSVATGATMSISWSVPAGTVGRSAYDWVGLYKVGDADDAPQWRQNVGSRTSRSVSVQMPSVAGDYEFRYFLSFKPTGEFKRVKDAQGNSQDIYVFNRKFTGEYRKVATSATVKVSSAALELVVLRTLAVSGESMKILWQSPAGQVSATDWVGLYKVGDADTAVAQWRHSTGGGDMGNMSVKLPTTAGDYEFRYFSGTGNMKKATSQKVTVVDASSYKLEVSGTSVTSGSRIGMLWQLPVGQASEQDWVGLYKVGDADTAPQWEASTQGKVMGSFSVQMPSTVGDYEFRYFFDKGYRKVATSAKVTVRASTGSGTSGSAGGKSSGRIRTEVIRYTYDGWDVIRENSSAKGITTYQNGLGIDNKLRSKNRRTVRYFLTDHLGSTEALTDSSGKVVSSTSYDSFGNATSNIATSYRYTGREYDSETGLYYYRNRWYDPETGRFISKDPIGFAGGDINLYGYVSNNPLSFVDPLGNYACRNQKRQKGGYPGARLGDCLKLNVPGFGALPKVARTLLKNTFGKIGALIIYEWNFSNYEKAVFVNTVVAAAYVGADFSNARFGGFYSADGTPNGIYVTGLKGIKRERHKIGKKGDWDLASVEYEDDHIDVDLYHSGWRHIDTTLSHFFLEWIPNKFRGKGTRPWDVAKKLKEKANIDTGVSCKEII